MIDDIYDNADDFGRALQKMLDRMEGDVSKGIQKAAIDLFSRIVEKTPVDTGRAKANWSITVDPNPDTNNYYNYPDINEFTFDLKDKTIYIYNNLNYIEALENGWSQQAPIGMVSVSLADFADYFNRALSGIDGIEPE